MLVSECLELLGAINPMRLYTDASIDEDLSAIPLHVQDQTFIVELISELGTTKRLVV